jgi:hypothetical protein
MHAFLSGPEEVSIFSAYLSDGVGACRTNSSSSVSLGSITSGPRITESNTVIVAYTGEDLVFQGRDTKTVAYWPPGLH